MEYVLGFAFDEKKENVLLIKKLRPQWQLNKLNGIGGKIEPNEPPIDAMIREFEEECGLKTNPDDWVCFCKMVGEDFFVNVYKAFVDINNYKNQTDEELRFCRL